MCPIIVDRAALKGSWVSWAGGGSPWDSFCSEAERPGWAQSTGLGGRGARSGYLKMARAAGLQEVSPPKLQNVSVRNAVSGFHSRAVELSWDRITESLPFFLRPGCPILWPHLSSGDPTGLFLNFSADSAPMTEFGWPHEVEVTPGFGSFRQLGKGWGCMGHDPHLGVLPDC